MFIPQELETLLTTIDPLTPTKRALTDVVIAIGLQCKPCEEPHDHGLSYFRDAQSQAFAGMLEDPDIDMVRTFLLMAFYLLGECRRNTAFMYLGIAARAAVALGLHRRETYTDVDDPQHQLRYGTDIFCPYLWILIQDLFVRLLVWMSLRTLDVVVNALLGRPAATAGVHSNLNALMEETSVSSPQDRGVTCLVASCNIASLINSIVDKIYDRKQVTITVVEELLQRLENWNQALPEFLRKAPSSAFGSFADPSAAKGAIGKIHVSCLYYLAVTLVTRPILISILVQHSSGSPVHSRLAAACLDAATFLIQICVGARKNNLLQSNMCILK